VAEVLRQFVHIETALLSFLFLLLISGTELPAGKLPSDLIAGSFGGNNVVILWKIGVQIFLDVIGKA